MPAADVVRLVTVVLFVLLAIGAARTPRPQHAHLRPLLAAGYLLVAVLNALVLAFG